MPLKLLGNDLLLRRVVTTKVGHIFMPPSMLDPLNAGLVETWRLVAKGTAKPFEANVGDNLVVLSITRRPQDVGDGLFILKNPGECVVAVIPVQSATPSPDTSESLRPAAPVETEPQRPPVLVP